MPTFRITFDQPVNYLPDHPKGRRLGIQELYVNADTVDQAKAHALRVTTGAGVIVEAGISAVPPPPAIEAPEAADPANLVLGQVPLA